MSIAERSDVEPEERAEGDAPARVLSLYPQVTLARIVARVDDGWMVRVGRREVRAIADPSVDSKLLEEALETGTRVVLEIGERPLLVGTLQTRRALQIAPDDTVVAEVNRFTVQAREEVVLKTRGAFVQLEGERVEVYAPRIVARAREVVRLLGAMIKLN